MIQGETNLDIWALHRDCTTSVMRVEARQRYVVPGDAERQLAFAEGRILPMRPGKQTWLQFIADSVAGGKRIARIHVVERPLTDYLEYELRLAYRENAAAGETIHIVDRSAHADLGRVTRDFVIFDAETDESVVVFYNYDDGDRLLGLERVDDQAVVAECRNQIERAMRHALTLDQFMATIGG